MAVAPAEVTRAETAEVATFLDDLARALIARDFDAHADMIETPFVVVTRADRYVYPTRDALRRPFGVWCRTLDAHAATAVVHRVCDVRRLGTGGFIVDYDTELRSGEMLALPSFKNLIFLQRAGAELKADQIVSGLSNAGRNLFLRVDPENTAPRLADTAESGLRNAEPDPFRPGDNVATKRYPDATKKEE